MSGMNKETLAGFADVHLDSEDNDVMDSFNKSKQVDKSTDINESFKSNESNDIDTTVGIEDSFKQDNSQDNDNILTVKDSGNQDNDTDNSTHVDADLDFDASTNDSHNQDNDVLIKDSGNTDNSVDIADSFNTDKSVNDSHNTDIRVDASRQVLADDGAVAAGGDVSGAVNTGALKGVQSNGPTLINDSNIGDGNIKMDDIQGNVALGGDVTDIDGQGGGGPINVGGTQFNTTANGGGNANTIVGDGNEVAGDQTAIVAGNEGPSNVNFGDNVSQKAVETNETDNSVNIDDSFNQDNDQVSTVDITDSFTSDDDLTATHTEETHVDIDDSFKTEDDHSTDIDLDLDADLDITNIEDVDHSGISVDG